MSGFGTQFALSPQPSTTAQSSPSMHAAPIRTDRREERAARSSSDDSVYGRGEQSKIEGDEDGNSLTSQTLNADGTPKRPMNAFMIFARRRRPQVSSENQSMRTGEISKILSKEWVSMPASEKQFYLEQAKQLKETFNTKYPDYVYRRRPNNSRKRRRSDSNPSRSMDQALFGDNPDDFGGGYDLEPSPTDGDDYQDTSISPSYPRHAHDISPTTLTPKFGGLPHRGSIGQSFSPHEPPFRSNGPESHRLSFSASSPTDRIGQSVDSNGSPRLSMNSMPYSYGQASGHSQVPPVFGTDSTGSQQTWPQRGSHWMTGADRPGANPRSTSYSPPTTWTTPGEAPSTNAAQSSGSPSFFPTISTPLYSNSSNVPTYSSNGAPTSSHPPLSTPSHYDDVGHFETTVQRDYGARIYSSSVSPVLPSPNPSYPLNRDSAPFSQQRTLPPMQTLGYSHSHSLTSPSNGHSASQPTYWRD